MTHTVGIVKPSNRPGRTEDLDPILPPGIRLISVNLNIYSGSSDELYKSMGEYGARINELAAAGATLVHPAGAPPLLLGYEGEQKQIAQWEAAAGVPVFTNGSSQVNALRALGAKRMFGLSYFAQPLNEKFAQYYGEAGFDVMDMVGLKADFQEVIKVPQPVIDEFVRSHFHSNPGADAILLIGPAWRTMDLVEGWERDFGVPIVHHVQAQSWEMQRRLGLRHPVQGYGRLTAQLPGLPG